MSGETLAGMVRLASDRQAIQQVLAIHGRGIDRRDAALLRTAYHDDATVAYGFFEGAATEFSEAATRSTMGLPVTMHRSHAPLIRLDGDTARAETYVIAYTEFPGPDGATQSLIGGRYLDRLERRAGIWRLAHRQYVLDWNMNQPSTVLWEEGLYAKFRKRGADGAADPSHADFAGWLEPAPPPAPPEDAGARIAGILAKQALSELVLIYCRALDRCDEALLRSIWDAGATVEYGLFDGDAQEFSHFVVELDGRLVRCFHCVCSSWFELSGDRAVGESYLIALATASSATGDQDTLIGGRYVDRFQRRDGVWKLARRRFVLDWSVSGKSTCRWDGPLYGSLGVHGGRGAADPVYAFWAD